LVLQLMFNPTFINIHWRPLLLPYRMTYGFEDPTEVPEFGTATSSSFRIRLCFFERHG
jgi:hypothetical protein